MYLDYVLLWPDDVCFTAETRRLEINYKVFCHIIDYICCVLDGNKYHFVSYPPCNVHAPYYIVICGLPGSTIFFHIIS